MNRQTFMYVIAIVLSAVVLPRFVWAQDISAIIDTNAAIRNETVLEAGIDATATVNAQTEEEKQNTETTAATSEPKARTGSALTRVTDTLIAGTIDAGVTPGSEDFCDALNDTLMDQSSTLRSSLAWNAWSYSKNIDLRAAATTDEQKELHDATKEAFKDATVALKALKPRSSSEEDSLALYRAQAVVRSALIEMNVALKAKDPDAERINKLADLLEGASDCVKTYSSAEESNESNLASVITSMDSVVKAWSDNQDTFGVTDQPEVITAFSVDIDSDDLEEPTEGEAEAPSASEVSSEEELEAFVKALMREDERVKQVTMDEDTVELSYAMRGRFLGFIPVWVTPTAEVNSDGEVDVDYPWYKGLSSVKNKLTDDELRATLAEAGLIAKEEIETEVDTKTATVAETDEVTEEETDTVETEAIAMSMEYRAQIVSALRDTFKAKVEASAEVETDEENTEEEGEPAPVDVEVETQA